MKPPALQFVKPYNVAFDRGLAIVTLADTGAVHRLSGPAASVARRVVAGDLNPSLWSTDEQDVLAVLCDLGVLEFVDHTVNRRALIAGATALGITTLAMPSAVAAASGGGEGSGGGGGGGYLAVSSAFEVAQVDYSGVAGANVVTYTTVLDNPTAYAYLMTPMDNGGQGSVSIDYVLVGGGGGTSKPGSGGGGGGQVVTGSTTLTSAVYAEVGAGGIAATLQGTSGGQTRLMIQGYPSNTTLSGTSAALGGGGGYGWQGNPNYGRGGASAYSGGAGADLAAAGGGGGAGGVGGDGSKGASWATGGSGGDGITITGFAANPILVGGGGGGFGQTGGGTNEFGGGTGANGSTITGSNGTHGTGGGGGGSMDYFSTPSASGPGAGGRGLIMVKTTAIEYF